MKALKIIGISVAALLLLVIGSLFAIPFFFKGKIVEKVKTEANKNLNAKVNFDNDISLSLFRSFPRLSLEIENLTVAGVDSFAEDTLFKGKSVFINLNLMDIINGDKYHIHRIVLQDPVILLKILPSGKANWNIAKETVDGDTAVYAFEAEMEHFEIKNGSLVYDDREIGFYTSLTDVNHTTKGNFTQDIFDMVTHTEAKNFEMTYEKMSILSGVDLIADATVGMDMLKSIYTFKENKFYLNDLPVNFNGMVGFDANDNILMDFSWDAPQADLKNFLSLIPAIWQNKFKEMKTTGSLAFKGMVKGTYTDNSYPTFNLSLKAQNGSFRYPQMPLPMNKINFDLLVDNKDGVIDHTIINLNHLNFNLAGDPFAIKLMATNPTTDPFLDAEAKGKINLDNFTKLIPFEKKTTLSGHIIADLMVKGRQSAIEKADIEKFNASGNLNVTNLKYQTSDMPEMLTIDAAVFELSPEVISVPELTGSLGKNDIAMNGQIENFFGYSMKGETLKGNLTLKSNYFNANDFLAEEQPTTKDSKESVKMTVVEIPGNVDFNLKSNFGTLVYDKYILKNVVADLIVKDKILDIKKLTTDVFGGMVGLSGNYNSADIKNPLVDMNLSLLNIDIKSIFETVNTIKVFAPIAKFASGKFTSTLNLRTLLDQGMMPVLSNLNAKGLMDLMNVEVDDVQSLNNIASKLNTPSLKKLSLKNLLMNFKIENGMLSVDPFELPFGDASLSLKGFSKIDQVIQYEGLLKLPKEMLGNQQKFYDDFVKNSKFKTLDLQPKDVLEIGVKIGGTFLKPDVKLALNEVKARIGDQVKDAVVKEIDKQKEAAEKKAREEMDKAKAQMDETRRKAEEDARKAVEAEKKKAEAELQRQKAEQQKKIEEDAKKKAKELIKKPPF